MNRRHPRGDRLRRRTYPVVLKEGGAFSLDIDGLRPDTYHLKLSGLHANGSAMIESSSALETERT